MQKNWVHEANCSLVLSVYLNKNLKLEKILNRSENGRKQFTRFDSKHMTLVIDNKKWPCKRIHKELRTHSKIKSYRNKKDGNIPC
jgi:hypothetical protein